MSLGWIGDVRRIQRFRFIVGDDPLNIIGKYEGDI